MFLNGAIREVAYGTLQRSFELPEGVDVAQVEAKYAPQVRGGLEHMALFGG